MQKFRNFRAACPAPRKRRPTQGRKRTTRRDPELHPQILQDRLTFFILARETDFLSRLIKSHPPRRLAVSQLDNMKTEACPNRVTDLPDVHFDDHRKEIWRHAELREKSQISAACLRCFI